MSKRREDLIQLLIMLSGLLIALVIILLTSQMPQKALYAFFVKPFTSLTRFGNMLSDAVPLTITGLAICVSFKASVWNLGAEGQAYFGMVTGWLACYLMTGWPVVIALPLTFVAAFCGGAILCWISAFLAKKFSCNMMMSSLLISNVMIDMCMLFVERSPYYDPESGLGIATYQVDERFLFKGILGRSDLDMGLFVALFLFVVVTLMLERSKLGYEIRMTGSNARFARYGGINTVAVSAIAMMISGGLAATGGMVYVLSNTGRVLDTFSNIGWTGMSVAMIAQQKPKLVIPVAVFIAYITAGAQQAQLSADIGPTIAQIIEGAVLLFVTSTSLMALFASRKKAQKEEVRA